ncbi:MAG: heme ABC transporter permease [Alphaproteobacteria bacterium]|nr:heme ABC transporter permease [Alphaproteobacteria bacterium]NCQ67193.1 heme ABC transporter permease [Alphaproteobacteria bacterium]NCT07037.1 heme ABC transporter permease [Alphaproteobacteria bacterium]
MAHQLLRVSFYHWLRRRTLSAASLCAALCLGLALYLAFFNSPLDYQQKETVRIMYVHVPAAWLAMMIYAFMGLCAIGGFIWHHSLAFIYARAAAPVGLCFTLIALVTGSIWGKPMWGTWWVWDARLTSMLVLAFLYAGYILFVQAFSEQEKASRMGAFLLILGLVNLPVIKYSVEWWSTLHQPAGVFKSGGSDIDKGMLWPLGFAAGGFLLFGYVLGLLRVETLLLSQKLKRQMILESRKELYHGT